MRFSDPWRLAFFNALLVMLVFILTCLVLTFFHPLVSLYLLIGSVCIFLFSFFLFRFTLEKFIHNKIRLIYKIIRRQKTPKPNKHKRVEALFLDKVEQEVQEWTQQQQSEIDELKKMAEFRREFLGNISHELKTPIFNIQGYVLTLLDGGVDDPSINKEYLLRTEKSINRMIAIIEDLEAISRLESGELKLHYSTFDIVDLTAEVIEILEPKAEKNKIKLNRNHAAGKPVLVNADREKIRQVLTNLLDNCIKYGKPGGNAKVSYFDMDETILIEVADNGYGIEENNLPRLFERFYRTDKARSREEGGSGLGLAIVKHIIEAHEQTVSVRSTVGIGTTFGFMLLKGT